MALQQLGLEGIMGQPNLLNFAAAASSVLGSANLHVSPNSTASLTSNVNNSNVSSANNSRGSYAKSSSNTSSGTTALPSLSAKRTRLDGILGSNNVNQSSVPFGARCPNLVSLVSASDNSEFFFSSSSKQEANLVSKKAKSQSSNALENINKRSANAASLGQRGSNLERKTVRPQAVQSNRNLKSMKENKTNRLSDSDKSDSCSKQVLNGHKDYLLSGKRTN